MAGLRVWALWTNWWTGLIGAAKAFWVVAFVVLALVVPVAIIALAKGRFWRNRQVDPSHQGTGEEGRATSGAPPSPRSGSGAAATEVTPSRQPMTTPPPEPSRPEPCPDLASRLCRDAPTALCERAKMVVAAKTSDDCERYLKDYGPGLWKVIVAGWPMPREWNVFRLGSSVQEFLDNRSRVALSAVPHYPSSSSHPVVGCDDVVHERVMNLPELPMEKRTEFLAWLRPASAQELRDLPLPTAEGPGGLPLLKLVQYLPNPYPNRRFVYGRCWINAEGFAAIGHFVGNAGEDWGQARLFSLTVWFGSQVSEWRFEKAELAVVVDKAVQKYGELWIPVILDSYEYSLARSDYAHYYYGSVMRCDDKTAVFLTEMYEIPALVLVALDIILDEVKYPTEHAEEERTRQRAEQEKQEPARRMEAVDF